MLDKYIAGVPTAPEPAPPSLARRAAPWAAIALLFVAVRVVLIAVTYLPDVDSVRYMSLGRLYARGEWSSALASPYHPLYPALLGFATAPFADPELPARILSLVFSALSMIPMGLIALRHGGRGTALATLAIYALLPHPTRLSVEILSDPLFVLLVLSQAACLLALLDSWNWKTGALAGLFAGLAYLTRPEGVFPLAAFAAAALIPRPGAGSLSSAQAIETRGAGEGPPVPFSARILALAVGAAVLAAAAVPYMIHLGGITAKKRVARLAGSGEYRPSEPHPMRAPQLPLDRGPGASLPLPDLSAWGVAGQDPDVIARQDPVSNPIWRALGLFGKAGHFVTPLLVIFGFALSRLGRKPARRDLFFALVAIIGPGLVLALLIGYRYASLRHAVPATVLTLPLAGFAVAESWRLGKGKFAWPVRGAVVLWAVLFSIFFVCQDVRPQRYPKRWIRQSGEALRPLVRPGDLLISDDPRIAWYAHASYLGLGMMSREELVRVCRENRVRFLLMDRGELRRRVPDFGESPDPALWNRLMATEEAGTDGTGPVAYEFLG